MNGAQGIAGVFGAGNQGSMQDLLAQVLGQNGVAGNVGDYAWGDQFESILNRLFAQSGQEGPPPTDDEFKKNLPEGE